MTGPAVSVVVPARNAEDRLARLLPALSAQTLGRGSFEAIVANDASRDGTEQVARDAGASVVSQPRRRGSYAARNLGLAAARAEIIAFLDADCVPNEDWLEQGLADLGRLQADVLGGRVDAEVGGGEPLTGIVDLARCLDQRRCVEQAGYAATANVFVRRRVFDSIGPFNDRLISGGDVEFSLRAAAAGHRVAYSDRAAVAHPLRARPSLLIRKALRTGFGAGQWEHVATGPLREHRAPWRSRSSFRPQRDVTRGTRAAAYAGTRRRALQADAAHYVLLQLPRLAGSWAASVTRGRALHS